jgi:hypothetical protein
LELRRAAAKVPVHPKVKALSEILPVTLVSLLTNPTRVVPRVEEPVPPFDTPKIPVTSEPERVIAPLNKAPAEVLLTGKALLKLAMVVEPL